MTVPHMPCAFELHQHFWLFCDCTNSKLSCVIVKTTWFPCVQLVVCLNTNRAKQAIGRAAAAPLPDAGLSSHQRIRATSAPEGSTLRACPSEPRRDLNHRTIVPRPLVHYSSPTVTILYLFTLHTTLLSSTSFTSAHSTKKARQSPYYTQLDLRLSERALYHRSTCIGRFNSYGTVHTSPPLESQNSRPREMKEA